MTSKSSVGLVLVALLLSRSAAKAAPMPVEVKWSELGAMISGRVVELTLPGGPKLKGDVVTVREDALVLDVVKTSDAKAYPYGSASIPRESVTTLKLEESRGHWRRNVGAVIGIAAALRLGVLVDKVTPPQKDNLVGPGLGVGLIGAVVGSIAGYHIGAAADKKVTVIRIVP